MKCRKNSQLWQPTNYVFHLKTMGPSFWSLRQQQCFLWHAPTRVCWFFSWAHRIRRGNCQPVYTNENHASMRSSGCARVLMPLLFCLQLSMQFYSWASRGQLPQFFLAALRRLLWLAQCWGCAWTQFCRAVIKLMVNLFRACVLRGLLYNRLALYDRWRIDSHVDEIVNKKTINKRQYFLLWSAASFEKFTRCGEIFCYSVFFNTVYNRLQCNESI